MDNAIQKMNITNRQPTLKGLNEYIVNIVEVYLICIIKVSSRGLDWKLD